MQSHSKVVIVGAGPIGLAHAWGIKKLNPAIDVVVLEKYEEYQRKHTLVVEQKPLEDLMLATNTQRDPSLCALLTKIKQYPHVRTNELETIFKKIATDSGVKILIDEVKKGTIDKQLSIQSDSPPSLVIGADGTHSVVSDCLFS